MTLEPASRAARPNRARSLTNSLLNAGEKALPGRSAGRKADVFSGRRSRHHCGGRLFPEPAKPECARNVRPFSWWTLGT